MGSLAGSWSGGQFDPGHMLASAIVGGAASVLGGGKFLNGAITSAFAYAATAKYGEETENLSGGNTPPSDASKIPGLTKQLLPYLHVEGNTLVGTATVQCQAGIDCTAIVTDLSNLNHQYANGYKIDILFVSVSGQMSANIVVGYDMNNICIAAIACIGDYGHILLTSEYRYQAFVMDHEFGHILGFTDSLSPTNVMLWHLPLPHGYLSQYDATRLIDEYPK